MPDVTGSVEMVRALREARLLSMLDEQVALGLGRLAGESRPEALLAAALVSRATRQGHVCLELAKADAFATDEEGTRHVELPNTGRWLDILATSHLVGAPSDAATPLVLSGERLYLRRYYRYEERLAAHLVAKIGVVESVDAKLLREGLDRLFPRSTSSQPDLQRLAALVAVVRRFCIVSGGPGTGKTTTVVKILALLQEQAIAQSKKPLHVMLVAPTGKAAARLRESIQKARAGLACEDRVKALVPDDAMTIHRRLSPVAGSPTKFRHNAENPLPCDVLLVDEASMVDLPLMTRLVDALPAHARLVMLGDRNQLASVETGAILGDLCGPASEPAFSPGFARRLEEVGGEKVKTRSDVTDAPGIWDCVVQLQKSWRYGEGSGIEALARAINAGDDAIAAQILTSGDYPDVALKPGPTEEGLGVALRADVVEGYRAYASSKTPKEAAQALERYRVLCAHRTGPYGVEAINPLIEKALAEERLLAIKGPWYARRPVMVTENDYAVSLFNGDFGVVFQDDGGARVHFFTADWKARALAPSRLPSHETVFAMSVHKAQGSEMEAISLVLPATVAKILTRELAYTAVTRARARVVVHGTIDPLQAGIRTILTRASAIGESLWATRGTERGDAR